MQRARSFHFENLKSYFYENFRFVKNVEVIAQKESQRSFKALVKVFVQGKWVVVKRRGEDVDSLLSEAKRAMDSKLRRIRDKAKKRPKQRELALNFI